MIKHFKHKGLSEYFIHDVTKWLNAHHLPKIKRILDRLDAVETVTDMNIPGWGFHELKGNRKGQWSVIVAANWRITFRFENGEAYEVDLEDYH